MVRALAGQDGFVDWNGPGHSSPWGKPALSGLWKYQEDLRDIFVKALKGGG